MSRKQKGKIPGAVIPIRLPAHLQQDVKRVAGSEGISEADVIRMALARGIPILEKLFTRPKETAA